MAFNENVLKRAQEREQKMGIYYNKKGGGLYNICKWIYVLAFIFTMAVNAIYITGIILIKQTLSSTATMNMDGFITVCILTGVMLFTFILSKFNANPIVAGVFGGLNVALSLCFTIVYAQLLGNTYVNLPAKFYLVHLLPLSIILLCSLAMASIVINSYLKTKKSYELVLEVLFREYNNLPDDEKPEWEDFITNYKF